MLDLPPDLSSPWFIASGLILFGIGYFYAFAGVFEPGGATAILARQWRWRRFKAWFRRNPILRTAEAIGASAFVLAVIEFRAERALREQTLLVNEQTLISLAWQNIGSADRESVTGDIGQRAAIRLLANHGLLAGADLSNRQLRLAALGGADLSFANLSGVDLRGADLSGADLGGADLRRADLAESDLSDTHFVGVLGLELTHGGASFGSFIGADLRNADLRGADLSGANLRGVDLRDADLSFTDLSNASFEIADLGSANLEGAFLIGADLGGAILSEANLKHADLSGADLSGAYFANTDLTWARLENAIGIDRAQYSDGCVSRRAIAPQPKDVPLDDPPILEVCVRYR